MNLRSQRIGQSQSPVLVVDDIDLDANAIRNLAISMAPFPPAGGTYYPGVRRIFIEEDRAAQAYVFHVLARLSSAIQSMFEVLSLALLESSFSMVTAQPGDLRAEQRARHFDDLDPSYLAVLHYLNDAPNSGTAFYRHRATGIECVNRSNAQALITMLKLESVNWHGRSYINGSNESFDLIDSIESRPNRIIIYPGALLHSAIIPADANLSDDPALGRLTANIFVRGRMA